MTVTDTPFLHSFDIADIDPELLAAIAQEDDVDIDDIALAVERSALGADLVAVRGSATLLIEQYALLLDDLQLTEEVKGALLKFKKWLFQYSYLPKF